MGIESRFIVSGQITLYYELGHNPNQSGRTAGLYTALNGSCMPAGGSSLAPSLILLSGSCFVLQGWFCDWGQGAVWKFLLLPLTHSSRPSSNVFSVKLSGSSISFLTEAQTLTIRIRMLPWGPAQNVPYGHSIKITARSCQSSRCFCL